MQQTFCKYLSLLYWYIICKSSLRLSGKCMLDLDQTDLWYGNGRNQLALYNSHHFSSFKFVVQFCFWIITTLFGFSHLYQYFFSLLCVCANNSICVNGRNRVVNIGCFITFVVIQNWMGTALCECSKSCYSDFFVHKVNLSTVWTSVQFLQR